MGVVFALTTVVVGRSRERLALEPPSPRGRRRGDTGCASANAKPFSPTHATARRPPVAAAAGNSSAVAGNGTPRPARFRAGLRPRADSPFSGATPTRCPRSARRPLDHTLAKWRGEANRRNSEGERARSPCRVWIRGDASICLASHSSGIHAERTRINVYHLCHRSLSSDEGKFLRVYVR